MEKEIRDGIGTIESKEESVKKDGDKYWKFKIILEGEQNALTFSLWDYKVGQEVNQGDDVKIFWTEKAGQGLHGTLTYRNINSIGRTDKYGGDYTTGKTDEQLAKLEKEGNPPANTQTQIVRQSCLGYAAQILAVESQWGNPSPDDIVGEQKKIAEELEKWVSR